MLNEIIEYDQYSFDCDIETNKTLSRLTHRNICNGLSGIERAMTTVARYYYYNYYSKGEMSQAQEERIEFVRSVLKAWCGLMNQEDECPLAAKHIEDWLPKYIENMLKKNAEGNELSLKRLEESLEKLKNKKSAFSKRLFVEYISDDEANKWKNDFKKITYDSIIANAIELGELKERVLLSKTFPFERIKKEKGNINSAEQDRVIKIISAFLLNRVNANQMFAVVNKADIANWCKESPKMDKDDYQKFKYRFGGEDVPLFESVLIANNIVKFKVAPELLGFCEFVICENDANILNSYIEQGYKYIYRDSGSVEFIKHEELKKVCD